MQVLFLKIIQKWYEPVHRERDFNALQLKNLLHRDHLDEERPTYQINRTR